jgi:starch synthase
MKGAIEASNAVTTVSPTYVKEIAQDYSFGWGLTPYISCKSEKFTGILNGIDGNGINPSKDKYLYKNYDINNFKDGKTANKLALQKELGLEENKDIPIIGMVTRISAAQKGCELIAGVLDKGLLNRTGAQFVLLGSAAKGDNEGKSVERDFERIAEDNEGQMAVYIGYSEEMAQKIYASSDIYIMPSKFEPCGLSQMIALTYGTVPVVRKTGGLADTVTDCGDGQKGNGFTFEDYTEAELGRAIERALSAFENSENWDKLIKRAMSKDYSWDKSSAVEYTEFYKSLLT